VACTFVLAWRECFSGGLKFDSQPSRRHRRCRENTERVGLRIESRSTP
jgi:hypothetical protein